MADLVKVESAEESITTNIDVLQEIIVKVKAVADTLKSQVAVSSTLEALNEYKGVTFLASINEDLVNNYKSEVVLQGKFVLLESCKNTMLDLKDLDSRILELEKFTVDHICPVCNSKIQ